ncbi:uncharacterized protein UTRI_05283 [Ustilago trichophora]|uniref:CCHC-type domain-containing protein n=1 Tax=Ustilago trichophora TaxID=86804 RepID=A0A5C3ELY8_9BASI|nr:uncharacterized protein UTRI_05283 [Ustilago trichophora]
MSFNQSSQDMMNTMPVDGSGNNGVSGSMHNPQLGGASRDMSTTSEVEDLRRLVHSMMLEISTLRASAQPTQAGARLVSTRPALFDGTVEDNAVRMWIMQVRDCISLLELQGCLSSETEKILYAANSLTGSAKEAWAIERTKLERTFNNAASPELQRNLYQQLTLEGFLEWIKTEFEDINAKRKRQKDYDNCVQGKRSVGEYLIEFSKFAERIEPPIPEDLRTEKFRSGLNREVLNRLSLVPDEPQTLRGLARFADKIYSRYLEDQAMERASKPMQDRPKSSKKGSYQNQGNSNQGQSNQRMEFLKKCRRENRCFKCGQTGHRSSSCIVTVPNERRLTLIEESTQSQGNGQDRS